MKSFFSLIALFLLCSTAAHAQTLKGSLYDEPVKHSKVNEAFNAALARQMYSRIAGYFDSETSDLSSPTGGQVAYRSDLGTVKYYNSVASAWRTFADTTTSVPPTRTINTTSPLTGGGDLSADRTFACATCLVSGGALGTPSSGTLTNTTGLPEGGLSLTDVTTNDASITKHGFLPKLPNDATKFLNGLGAWATVSAGVTCSGCTTNTLPKTTGVGALGDSRITDNGSTTIDVAGSEDTTVSVFAGTNYVNVAGGASDNSVEIFAPTINVVGTNLFLFGNVNVNKTITVSGTTGAQTINDKTLWSVNFAAAATSLVVTSNYITTSSGIVCTVNTNDATLKSVQAVPASGSATLFGNAAAGAETKVTCLVIN